MTPTPVVPYPRDYMVVVGSECWYIGTKKECQAYVLAEGIRTKSTIMPVVV